MRYTIATGNPAEDLGLVIEWSVSHNEIIIIGVPAGADYAAYARHLNEACDGETEGEYWGIRDLGDGPEGWRVHLVSLSESVGM